MISGGAYLPVKIISGILGSVMRSSVKKLTTECTSSILHAIATLISSRITMSYLPELIAFFALFHPSWANFYQSLRGFSNSQNHCDQPEATLNQEN